MNDLKEAARKVIERVCSVYSPAYIQKCVENEPESLLALVKNLESEIAKADLAELSVNPESV